MDEKSIESEGGGGSNEKEVENACRQKQDLIDKVRSKMNALKKLYKQTQTNNQEIIERIQKLDMPKHSKSMDDAGLLDESFDPDKSLLEGEHFGNMNHIFDEMTDFLKDQERQTDIDEGLSKLEDNRMNLYSKILDKLEDDGESAREKLKEVSEQKDTIRSEILMYKKRNGILIFFVVFLVFALIVLI